MTSIFLSGKESSMNNPKKRILVAIDHSSQALESASYISKMVDPDRFSVVIFHVESDLYDIFYDYVDKPPLEITGSPYYADWVDVMKKSIDLNLQNAKKVFLDNGFPEDAIEITRQPRQTGIARDIIAESHKGYDILVVGKSGINKISEAMKGNVTSKLMMRAFHIPLVIVSGIPETSKVLVGYDGSTGANMAAEASARLIRKKVSEILFCHVIRSFNLSDAQFSLSYKESYNEHLADIEEAMIKSRREHMEPLLDEARLYFTREGFTPESVRWCMINRSSSRSKAIIDMAEAQNCGTLVLGRRGHSAVVEFFMGRVGNKAVEMSRNMAVWII